MDRVIITKPVEVRPGKRLSKKVKKGLEPLVDVLKQITRGVSTSVFSSTNWDAIRTAAYIESQLGLELGIDFEKGALLREPIRDPLEYHQTQKTFQERMEDVYRFITGPGENVILVPDVKVADDFCRHLATFPEGTSYEGEKDFTKFVPGTAVYFNRRDRTVDIIPRKKDQEKEIGQATK